MRASRGAVFTEWRSANASEQRGCVHLSGESWMRASRGAVFTEGGVPMSEQRGPCSLEGSRCERAEGLCSLVAVCRCERAEGLCSPSGCVRASRGAVFTEWRCANASRGAVFTEWRCASEQRGCVHRVAVCRCEL